MKPGGSIASKIPPPDKLAGGGGYGEAAGEGDEEGDVDDAAEASALEELTSALGLKDVDTKAVGDALTQYLEACGFQRR